MMTMKIAGKLIIVLSLNLQLIIHLLMRDRLERIVMATSVVAHQQLVLQI
jgi:hypothetical protein